MAWGHYFEIRQILIKIINIMLKFSHFGNRIYSSDFYSTELAFSVTYCILNVK